MTWASELVQHLLRSLYHLNSDYWIQFLLLCFGYDSCFIKKTLLMGVTNLLGSNGKATPKHKLIRCLFQSPRYLVSDHWIHFFWFDLSSCNYSYFTQKILKEINPFNANLTKWSNTLKKFVGKFPANCLSVFGYFVNLVLKGLRK